MAWPLDFPERPKNTQREIRNYVPKIGNSLPNPPSLSVSRKSSGLVYGDVRFHGGRAAAPAEAAAAAFGYDNDEDGDKDAGLGLSGGFVGFTLGYLASLAPNVNNLYQINPILVQAVQFLDLMVPRSIRDTSFDHLKRTVQENGKMFEARVTNSFSIAEDEFLSLVEKNVGYEPRVAAVGSRCVIGLVRNDTLYVAKLSDSRAVRGYFDRANKIATEQHVSQKLKGLHSEMVLKGEAVLHVKGIIQVPRAIADAYLERSEFAPPVRFHFPKPIRGSVQGADAFQLDGVLIFASDGFWGHVTNQQAVELVHKNPIPGLAERLVKSALHEAAWEGKTSYDELNRTQSRCNYHDELKVVVIFIDKEALKKKEVGLAFYVCTRE